MAAETTHVARKIKRAKWGRLPFLEEAQVAADALSVDLRTRANRLSFWGTTPDEDGFSATALAIAAARDHAETLDVVMVPVEVLEGLGVQLRSSQGNTPVPDLRGRHADAVELAADDLCRVANALAPFVRDDSTRRRYTRSQVVRMLCAAIEAGRLDPEALAPDLRDAVAERQ